MQRKTVAFELTDREVRAFCFSDSLSGKQATHVRFDRLPIPIGTIEQTNVLNDDKLLSVLSTYCKQFYKKGQRAFLAIPLQQGIIRKYKLPWLPKRDRPSAISLLIAEEVPILGTDSVCDVLELSEQKGQYLQIIVGATRKSLLERYVNLFQKAGFSIEGITFSLFVLGQNYEFKQNDDVLFVHGESKILQIALFRGWVPESVRSFSQPEFNSYSDAEWVRDLELEVGRFLLYNRTQQADLNVQRLVWDGNALAGKLAEKLQASGDVFLGKETFFKKVPLTWQTILEDNDGFYEVVVGYGLQILNHNCRLNLWRQPLRILTRRRRYCKIALSALALFLAVVVINLALGYKALSLRQEIRQLASKGSGILTKIQHQDALESAWGKMGIKTEKVGAGLEQIQSLPVDGLKINQIIYKKGIVSLNGSAENAQSVENLIQTMRNLGWEELKLSNYQMESPNELKFSLSAKQGRTVSEGG